MPEAAALSSEPRPSGDTLSAALAGDQVAFSALTEPHRNALLAHCYRMLGSFEDAEDQVQETLLRAWRRLATYQGRGTLRAWLYAIATHACLDVLSQKSKRSLPDLLSPAADPFSPPLPPLDASTWLQPFPDELLPDAESGPEARYDSLESISFAFLIALQELPPRQRCALILGDVLDWQAAEIATALDVSVSAANSLLHRARSTLKQRYPREAMPAPPLPQPHEQQLLDRYVRLWQAADIDGIVSMLTEDAAFPMPPFPAWYQGRAAIRAFLQATILAGEAAGRWKLLPVRLNGQPGFAMYMRQEQTGNYLPFALQSLRFAGELLSVVITFGMPGLFQSFDLPSSVDPALI